MLLTPGQRIEAYEIVAAISTGGMGVVCRAQDRRLDRPVAIKFLKTDASGAADARLEQYYDQVLDAGRTKLASA